MFAHDPRLLSLLAVLVSSSALVACGSSSKEGARPITAADGGNGAAAPAENGGAPSEGGAAATGGSATLGECGLPAPPAAGITLPDSTAGSLTVLDWAGYKSAVSYTFDDANSSQIAHYDELQALGVRMTFYLQSNKSDAADPIWAQALEDGHELGNHTQTHCNVDGCSGVTDVPADTDACTEFLRTTFGVEPYTMAAPYGDTGYADIASTRFLVNRGVAGGSVLPNSTTNPFNLPCHIPATGAEASALDSVIDAAHERGAWQIVLVHGFTGGTDGAYQPVDIDQFTTHVEHTKSLGDAWVDSVVNVAAYWRGQAAVTNAETTTDGDATTWTWTLPDHFPPGHCLRIATSSGTLTQGGTPLTRQDPGYYEVALDAGSVTLTP